jgi:type I restriction enzyme, S subunit
MNWMTLENASEFITDGTHGSPKRTTDANGIPLLSAKNIFNGEIRWDEFDRVPSSELEEFQKRVQLLKGDVLMTCVGTIGRVAVWANERPVVFFRSVAIIRPKKNLNPKYLEYVIRSPNFQLELRRRTKRSSQGGIYLKDIKAMPIGLPPVAEQGRIAKLLDEADELCKLRAQADHRTVEFIPALFHNTFGSTKSVTPLKELADVVSGVAKGRKFNGEQPLTVPYVRVANVQDGYLDLSELKTIEALPQEIEELSLKKGDVLLTEGGDFDKLGRGAMLEQELPNCIHQNHVFRVRCHAPQMIPEYFAGFLRSSDARSYFLRCAKKTSNLASINMSQLRALPVPIVSLPLQKEFAERVKEIRKLESAQAQSRARLDALFASLLDKAFKGDL